MSFGRHAGKPPVSGSLAAPMTNGTLSPWIVDLNSGSVTYLTSVGFTGAELVYTLPGGATGLTINAGTGRITADTFTTAEGTTTLTVRATNSTSFAEQSFDFTAEVIRRRQPIIRSYAVQRAGSW